MDPVHFLSGQTFPPRHARNDSPAEIASFYDRHGLSIFAVSAQWRLWLRHRRSRTGATQARPWGFAPNRQDG